MFLLTYRRKTLDRINKTFQIFSIMARVCLHLKDYLDLKKRDVERVRDRFLYGITKG